MQRMAGETAEAVHIMSACSFNLARPTVFYPYLSIGDFMTRFRQSNFDVVVAYNPSTQPEVTW